MNRRIAYVEDNEEAREVYARLLRDVGFDVATYGDKDEAIGAFRRELPDLALLDVSHRGDRDAGYAICTELRKISADVPIIFLTNRHGEVDKISGFRLGADDYISKDASLDYVLVRIEALFRRLEAIRGARNSEPAAEPGLAGIEFDETYARVFWKGEPVDMPLTHYWIVRELCRMPGQVRSHRDLMKAASLVVEPNTIAAHVKSIRQAFTRHDPDFRCIKTERGRGYRWISD